MNFPLVLLEQSRSIAEGKMRLLGAFAKLRKATVSFVMSVRPSAFSEWNDSALSGRIFIKFDMWLFFEKLLRKLKFH